MTFFAVRRWYGWGAGPILNLDIGGGSFEMASGQDELPELATSVPLGASRLTRDWLHEDPPSAKSVKELRRYIRATLKPAVRSFDAIGRANLVAGTSKTFRSLARIAGAAPSARRPVREARAERHGPGNLGAADFGHENARTGCTCRASRRPAPTSSSPGRWWRKRPWNCSSSRRSRSAPGPCAKASSCAGWTSWSLTARWSRPRMSESQQSDGAQHAATLPSRRAVAADAELADANMPQMTSLNEVKRRTVSQKELGEHSCNRPAPRRSRRTSSITRTL